MIYASSKIYVQGMDLKCPLCNTVVKSIGYHECSTSIEVAGSQPQKAPTKK